VLLILIPLLSPNSSKGGVGSQTLVFKTRVCLDVRNVVLESGN
jgi:hypothetical protein